MLQDFENVVADLKAAILESSTDPGVGASDLRDILSFLTKVVQVVDQSFQDVYTLAIELAYVTPEDLASGRVRRLQQNLELLVARSHYQQTEEICSRLKHLRIRFDEYIKPAISHLPSQDSWRDLFWLIEEREGLIIKLVESAAGQLRTELENLDPSRLKFVNKTARDLSDQLRPLLMELRNFTNEILGLSGRAGFLELTGDRAELARAASVVINRGVVHVARDTYKVERAGAVGPRSTATNVTFNEGAAQLASQTDLKALAAQLEELRAEMLKAAREPSHYDAIAAVAKAEDATKKGQTSDIFSHLKSAGQWAFDTATKIGVSVAARAIQGAMGL